MCNWSNKFALVVEVLKIHTNDKYTLHIEQSFHFPIPCTQTHTHMQLLHSCVRICLRVLFGSYMVKSLFIKEKNRLDVSKRKRENGWESEGGSRGGKL